MSTTPEGYELEVRSQNGSTTNKDSNPMKPLVIYHDNCPDGFCAAWVAHRALGEIDLCPANYGDAPPDVTGRRVYVLDFSYPADQLIAMYEDALSLVVLDHHKTAKDALELLQRRMVQACADQARMSRTFSGGFCEHVGDGAVYFDLNRSGAGLAWDYLRGGRGRPWIVSYVEDRDLWRFALPESKEINAYLSTLSHELDAWDRLSSYVSPSDADAIMLGRAVLDAYASVVRSLVKDAYQGFVCGFEVPICNAGRFHRSELGHALLDAYPDAPFVAVWQRTGNVRRYSLRSEAGRANVREIAEAMGGGGHDHAAGFEVPTE